jgi:hypothetical protein
MAKDSQTPLKCLGGEELYIHTNKIPGPVYLLNQLLIDHLSASSYIKLKKKYLNLICKKDYLKGDLSNGPSINFLKISLLEGSNIYSFSSNELIRTTQEKESSNLLKKMPSYFFIFLNAIQSASNFPDCLNKYLKNFKYLSTRYHYLEQDLEGQLFRNEKKRIIEIFEDLKNVDSLINKCQNLAKKKYKAPDSDAT